MARPKKAVDMGFRCPGEIAGKLQAQAEQEGRSLAGMIRRILTQHYQQRPAKAA